MKEQFLTKEGFSELQDRLTELKTIRRRAIAEAIHTAKEQGDLSENAEYASAKEEQNRIEQEIAVIEMTVKNARVIKKTDSSMVSVGNIVTLDCDGQKRVYRIVGSNEANPIEGKISNESPVGQALLARQKGDTVVIPTPLGEKHCTIVEIA